MSIEKKSIQETTGNQNNVAQSFKQNIFYDVSDGATYPFIFEIPKYDTYGGTKLYYQQDVRAIFTNLVAPFIRFNFTANTSSFGPNTFIKHDIYRVNWDIYSTVQSGLKADADDAVQLENYTTEEIEEFDEATGRYVKKTIKRTLTGLQNSIKSSRKPSDRPSDRLQNEIVKPTVADIQKQLNEPIFSVTATTTGITSNIYDFQINQYIKNIGDFKTELFKDRDQYIVDTNFIFNVDVTPGLVEYEIVDPETGAITNTPYSSSVQRETVSDRIQITEGEFKGLEFMNGAYFSYFQVPDKPVFEYPTPTGYTGTFTPEIYWTNGEGADEYLVQVTYNTGDTGFTGTVFSYVVPKTNETKQEGVNKIKTSDSEFTTSKPIRKYQLSLKSNKCLLYRVGNVKVLRNMFGVKQSVVTFSEYLSACTQVEPIKTYVFTESDSPYTEAISGFETPLSLEAESPLTEYSLSGIVTGSTVTGATIQLIYPNSNFITTTTNSIGEFYFTGLNEGTYTLNTSYRGYASDSTSIVLSADTSLIIPIQIRWDNTYDIWAIKEDDIIKY
jgi:hypothetical protein